MAAQRQPKIPRRDSNPGTADVERLSALSVQAIQKARLLLRPVDLALELALTELDDLALLHRL